MMNQNKVEQSQKSMPTAEIVATKVALVKQISQLESQQPMDIDALNELLQKNEELNEKYDFFDRVFEENGKKGLKDITGQVRVPALYASFTECYHYDAYRQLPQPAGNEDRKYALVLADGSGTPLTPFVYDHISKLVLTPFFSVWKGKKGGVITATGEEVVPCIMDQCYENFNGISSFSADGKMGLFTNDGLYVAPVFDEMEEKEELIYVRLGDQWGYLDEDGRFIDEHDEDTLDNICCLSWFTD